MFMNKLNRQFNVFYFKRLTSAGKIKQYPDRRKKEFNKPQEKYNFD